MTRPARRAHRRYRCPRCWYVGEYPNATVAEARYWFSKHSCRRQEEKMLRAALAEEREANIDRTPKECRHKEADHQHGTNAAYILDKCRCPPCAAAHAAQEQWRTRQKAYGRYNKYVDAGPVRDHITALRQAGMGVKTIAKRSGVSHGALSKLIYGVYAPGPGGRNGKGDLIRPPSRRVLRTTAEKLYALDPDWTESPLPVAGGALVPAHGTVLRMRALVALGWSQSQLAQRLGIRPSNFRLATGCWSVQANTARAAAALYDEISMSLPPRRSRTRSKRYAAEHGWLPPLALDCDRLDDPGYEPWVEYVEYGEHGGAA